MVGEGILLKECLEDSEEKTEKVELFSSFLHNYTVKHHETRLDVDMVKYIMLHGSSIATFQDFFSKDLNPIGVNKAA